MKRDGLLKVLRGEKTDCVPVAPFIHVNFVREFFNDFNVDAVAKTIEVYEHFGFDIIHRNCTPAYNDVADISSDAWKVARTIEKSGSNQVIKTVISTPEGDINETFKVNKVTNYDEEAAVTDFLIKTEKDFEILRKYQPPVGKIDVSGIRRARQLLGEKGITAPWVQGMFNFVCLFYRKLDELIVDAMVNPDFYHSVMGYCLERNKQIISQLAETGTEMLSYGGNVASGKLVGADFFKQYIFPYEKALIDFVKSKGVMVMYHNCGYGSKLFGVYKDLGMNAYESLTPPPFGDTIFEKALEAMPAEVTLSGNIDQISFLKNAKPDEVRARVQQVLEKAKQRGNFILATTDYLLEQTPHENIFALSQAGKEFGGY